jgi:hypothetical protein
MMVVEEVRVVRQEEGKERMGMGRVKTKGKMMESTVAVKGCYSLTGYDSLPTLQTLEMLLVIHWINI